MEIEIKPLTPDLIPDYLFFFDNMTFTENPNWSKCYCFSFHFTGTREEWTRDKNRASVIKYIKEQKMKGYLAFSDGKPVGWCNANDRSNYQRLMKYYNLVDNPNDKACSIVCFLISPDFRRKGIARKMLQQICNDYKELNYDYLEAYPDKGDLSSEKCYKGPLRLYSEFDFKIEKEYKNYFIVRKLLR